MKLLHIVATPRQDNSNTMRVSEAFLERLKDKHGGLTTETIDLFQEDLPAVAGDNIEAKYTVMIGQPIDRSHKRSWRRIEQLIEHFLSADLYLISSPMWNFTVPYSLKYYIDAIVQPGYLFEYNEQGQAVGLVKNKKMICLTTRGGDYSPESPFHPYDFQEPYLRAIFGFIGITDMHFINAQPMDVTSEIREAAIRNAIEDVRKLADNLELTSVAAEIDKKNPADLKPKPLP